MEDERKIAILLCQQPPCLSTSINQTSIFPTRAANLRLYLHPPHRIFRRKPPSSAPLPALCFCPPHRLPRSLCSSAHFPVIASRFSLLHPPHRLPRSLCSPSCFPLITLRLSARIFCRKPPSSAPLPALSSSPRSISLFSLSLSFPSSPAAAPSFCHLSSIGASIASYLVNLPFRTRSPPPSPPTTPMNFFRGSFYDKPPSQLPSSISVAASIAPTAPKPKASTISYHHQISCVSCEPAPLPLSSPLQIPVFSPSPPSLSLFSLSFPPCHTETLSENLPQETTGKRPPTPAFSPLSPPLSLPALSPSPPRLSLPALSPSFAFHAPIPFFCPKLYRFSFLSSLPDSSFTTSASLQVIASIFLSCRGGEKNSLENGCPSHSHAKQKASLQTHTIHLPGGEPI